jgi:hypothetical protein
MVVDLLDVSGVVWVLLVTPAAIFAILTFLFSEPWWRLALAFSLGSAVMGTAVSYYLVEIARDFDGKFEYAPSVALELSLFGSAVATWLNSVGFGLPVTLFRPTAPGRPKLEYTLAAVLGGVSIMIPIPTPFPVASLISAAIVLYRLRIAPAPSPAPVQ